MGLNWEKVDFNPEKLWIKEGLHWDRSGIKPGSNLRQTKDYPRIDCGLIGGRSGVKPGQTRCELGQTRGYTGIEKGLTLDKPGFNLEKTRD